MAAKRSSKKAPRRAARAMRSKTPGPGGRAKSATETLVAQIQRVIDVMTAAGAVEVELEQAGSKLRVRLREEPRAGAYAAGAIGGPAAAGRPFEAGPGPALDAASGAGAAPPAPAAGQIFKSPMVGTFYRSPSPDAEPFVKEGDTVGEDTVICIIEAMKVMNEIKAEMPGQIVEILAQNGEPVDYGQPLFVIKT